MPEELDFDSLLRNRNDIDNIYEEYVQAKLMAEKLKKRFDELAERFVSDGVYTTPAGCKIEKRERVTDKIDMIMFRTLHEDRFNELVEKGQVSIPAVAYKDFRDEIADCIDSKRTTYFVLKNDKNL